ncbi:hypothetical protein CDAR_437041 [Caerostris darwini]|uniref:Uncharacterized protein n=1 Tax=Caerostris darwini TaxID=1538125 RepID=A0AAV4TUH9_9ARAC|nr:hypothetical protein CDAR_437041 [Caerostris darwini]
MEFVILKVAAGAVLTVGGAMVALPMAGFTAGGVAAGSIAAGIQSSIGVVSAGSIFAAAQSAGAAGMALTTKGLLAAGGAVLAAVL